MSQITELEELENTAFMGLSVWLADPTLNKVVELKNFRLKQSEGGKIVISANESGMYVSWFGITDKTYRHNKYEDAMRLFNDQQSAQNYSNRLLARRLKSDQQPRRT